jgi:hypothetical protein
MFMNNQIGSELTSAIRSLYEEDEGAKAFFDWAGARTNDAAGTSVDRISQVTGLSYSEARELAKALGEIGCGEFVVGRKGWKSRIRWAFSLRTLGKAASGENVEIEEVDPVLIEEAAEPNVSALTPALSEEGTLSIAEAKRRLAETLGVSVEAIAITITA